MKPKKKIKSITCELYLFYKKALMTQFFYTGKVVLLLLVTLGSVVFMSLVPVIIRRYYFAKYFKKKEDRERLAPEAILEFKVSNTSN